MRDSHLFSLKSIHEKFSDYYVDHNLTFYSAKRKGIETPVVLKSPRFSKSQGFPFNVYELIDRLKTNNFFQIYSQNQRLATDTQTEKSEYVVALIDKSGNPVFCQHPVVHTDVESAKDSVSRMAIRHAGKTFAYFKLMGKASVGEVTWL